MSSGDNPLNPWQKLLAPLTQGLGSLGGSILSTLTAPTRPRSATGSPAEFEPLGPPIGRTPLSSLTAAPGAPEGATDGTAGLAAPAVLAAGAEGAAAAPLPSAPVPTTPTPPEQIRATVTSAAREAGIDPALLRAVVQQESAFDPRAVSESGAMGLGQLMPATARLLGVTDPFDPAQNARAAARYLKDQLDKFGGDVDRALAAYNAGPAGNPMLPGVQAYVARVRDLYKGEQASEAPARPDAAAPTTGDPALVADQALRGQAIAGAAPTLVQDAVSGATVALNDAQRAYEQARLDPNATVDAQDRARLAVVAAQRNWIGLCEAFVEQATTGHTGINASAAAALDAARRDGSLVGGTWADAPPGAVLYFQPNAGNGWAGHVAIKTGADTMLSATDTGVRETSIGAWSQGVAPFAGWRLAPGQDIGRYLAFKLGDPAAPILREGSALSSPADTLLEDQATPQASTETPATKSQPGGRDRVSLGTYQPNTGPKRAAADEIVTGAATEAQGVEGAGGPTWVMPSPFDAGRVREALRSLGASDVAIDRMIGFRLRGVPPDSRHPTSQLVSPPASRSDAERLTGLLQVVAMDAGIDPARVATAVQGVVKGGVALGERAGDVLVRVLWPMLGLGGDAERGVAALEGRGTTQTAQGLHTVFEARPDLAESLALLKGFAWTPPDAPSEHLPLSVWSVGDVNAREVGGSQASEFALTVGDVADPVAWQTLLRRFDASGLATYGDRYDGETHSGSVVVSGLDHGVVVRARDTLGALIGRGAVVQPGQEQGWTPTRQPTPYEALPFLYGHQSGMPEGPPTAAPGGEFERVEGPGATDVGSYTGPRMPEANVTPMPESGGPQATDVGVTGERVLPRVRAKRPEEMTPEELDEYLRSGQAPLVTEGEAVGRGGATDQGTYAGPKVPEPLSVVPAGVARQQPTGVAMPLDPEFREAAGRTPGVYVDQDGLHIDLERAQKPQYAGEPVASGGVFYSTPGTARPGQYAVPPEFDQGEDAPVVGGSQRIMGRTLFRNPMAVPGNEPQLKALGQLTGNDVGRLDLYDDYTQALARQTGPAAEVQAVQSVLDRWGVPDSAQVATNIVQAAHTTSQPEGKLSDFLLENVVAAQARSAGYDSIIGYFPNGGITQIMDLRESRYPTPDGGFTLHPQFRPQVRGMMSAADARKAAGLGPQWKPLESVYGQKGLQYPDWTKRVLDALNKKMPKRASREQVEGLLKGLSEEERRLSGVDEALAEYTDEQGRVQKQDIVSVIEGGWAVPPPEETVMTEGATPPALAWQEDRAPDGRVTLYYADYRTRNGRKAMVSIRPMLNGLYTVRLPGGMEDVRQTLEDAKRVADEAYQHVGETPNKTRWNLPQLKLGGPHENYKEVVIRMPEGDAGVGDYTHSHWAGIKNPIMHFRADDRTGPDGEKVLHVEEVQADIHQVGHALGYEGSGKRPYGIAQEDGQWRLTGPGMRKDKQRWDTQDEAERKANNLNFDIQYHQPPNYPFKETWPEVVMRRIVRYAAENGYDKVTWTTGDQQVTRNAGEENLASEGDYHRRLYDVELGRIAKDIAKEFGGQVGPTPLTVGMRPVDPERPWVGHPREAEYEMAQQRLTEAQANLAAFEERWLQGRAGSYEQHEALIYAIRNRETDLEKLRDELAKTYTGAGVPIQSDQPSLTITDAMRRAVGVTPEVDRLREEVAEWIRRPPKTEADLAKALDTLHEWQRLRGEAGIGVAPPAYQHPLAAPVAVE